MKLGLGTRARSLSFTSTSLLASVLTLSGCKSSASQAGQNEVNGAGGHTDAHGDFHGDHDHARHDSRPDSGDHGGPSHHFEPRPQVSHPAPQVLPPPDLYSLPRFVDGAARCFPRPEATHYMFAPPHSGQGFGLSGSGVGGGGYGSGSGRLGGSHSTAPSAAPRAESKAADKGSPKRRAVAAVAAAPAEEAPARADDYQEEPRDNDSGFGQSIYLSNDDTMSLSSAQRVIFAIEQFAPLPLEHIRPHELLNYFSFATAPLDNGRDFSVLPSIERSPEEPGVETLALSVRGRDVSRDTRRNANLTYVVDRSGSMSAEGRMDYLKRGLLRSTSELKHGDIVNLTLFDTDACELVQNFVVGRDSMGHLNQLISMLEPRGSTNLHEGLELGYRAASRTYVPSYSNRVILVTDAQTNTGVVDQTMIAMVGKNYDERKVRLSGIGVGRDFNDALLDELTERGKGAYVFLGSEAEVDAVFGERFVSLIETTATDVHFRLHLPPSLAMRTFYGEEASVHKERVQAIHYFAGTSQMFLSDLTSRPGFEQDDIMFTIEYQDSESGEARVEEQVWNIRSLTDNSASLRKARMINAFAEGLREMASRSAPYDYREERFGYPDTAAGARCQELGRDLGRMASSVEGDPEVRRVLDLWSTFCGRYPTHAGSPDVPVSGRNNDFAPEDKWPGAR